ncbi:hypothetical protein [Mariniphaga sp.]|uniref:hypothetical protein n=1 Tax=Mariniphaga sp. TaxID=1954475 RepID=UPI0035634842
MIQKPNILLVAGTGRNIGKTITVCRIIARLAQEHEPVGVKISPHFHELDGDPKYLFQSENFVIVEEKNISRKDSSRMLQAGAKTVYYVQCKPGYLAGAMDYLLPLLGSESPVTVESGGLYDILEPGLLIFITGKEVKKNFLFRSETRVLHLNAEDVQQFTGENIHFINGKIAIDA